MRHDAAYYRDYYRRNAEKMRAKSRRWNAAHKKEKAEYMRKYRAQNRERLNEYARKWRERHPETARNYRQSENGKAVRKAWRTSWTDRNRELVRESSRRAEVRRKIRKMTDAAYYAKRRADARRYKAFAAMLRSGCYHPRFNLRLPDYVTMGTGLDRRSAFLAVNLTASQRAFVKELYRERYGI